MHLYISVSPSLPSTLFPSIFPSFFLSLSRLPPSLPPNHEDGRLDELTRVIRGLRGSVQAQGVYVTRAVKPAKDVENETEMTTGKVRRKATCNFFGVCSPLPPSLPSPTLPPSLPYQ